MDNVLTVSWYLMKKMKTGFGCAVMGDNWYCSACHKIPTKDSVPDEFIVQNAHKIVRLCY